ncbi:glycosyl hydrolase family 76-domain-containing protein [Obelidium mucronatum]|nr:glycosyl hydrolase family 76-domain-containing protein [Obelidium mucronatum]
MRPAAKTEKIIETESLELMFTRSILTAVGLSLATSSVVVAQAPVIDLTSKEAVVTAATNAIPFLKKFYSSPGQDGAWDQNLMQWHETGIYWELFYAYASYSKDSSYNDWIDSEMLPCDCWGGRWNDDIGWWALATMTAAEHFGKDAIIAPSLPGNSNPKYIDATHMTYLEMLDQWDTSKCNGGMYWSRNRNSNIENQLYYKSTISNAQHLDLGARLYVLTGDKKFIEWFDRVYAWLKSSNLITSTYSVYDGLDTRNCEINQAQFSYHSSELINGLAVMYKATNNAEYLTEAHNHFNHVASFFVNNATGVLYDPQAGEDKTPSGFLWSLYRALATLYTVTPDENVKTQIATILRTSATANFKTCTSDWNCITKVSPVPAKYTLPDGSNVRAQMETVAILNALAVVNGVTVEKNVAQVVASGGGVAAVEPSDSGVVAFGASAVLLVLSSLLL